MNATRTTRRSVLPVVVTLLWLVAGLAIAQQDDGQDQVTDSPIALELVADGFVSPVLLTSPPDDDRRFVVDRVGMIYVLDENGERLDEPFLDVSDRVVELQDGFDERGLLGLAFHPQYADNGRFYVYYSAPLREEAPDDWNHTARVSEFKAMAPGDDAEEGATRADSNVADPGSERVLLRVDQPQFNHDGGAIDFGPDGFLYIALGDGGAADDVGLGHPPMGHGQDTRSLLGSILRIDVDRGWPGYAIPADNPFVGELGPDEIYSWGWRNPWRMSFDASGNGDLYVGTNGQNLWEAIYRIQEPVNAGWNLLEAAHCFDPEQPGESPPNDACDTTGPDGEPLELPVIEYPHPANQGDSEHAGISVVGGYMYRGDDVSALQGRYVFGDWSLGFSEPGGQIFAATPNGDIEEIGGEGWEMEKLAQLDRFVLGFGEDSEQELYVLTTETTGPTGTTGAVHRIVSADDATGEDGANNGAAQEDAADDGAAQEDNADAEPADDDTTDGEEGDDGA